MTAPWPNPHMAGSPLVGLLRQFAFPSGDYAVFGSGPMLPAGLRAPRDLDLVARGQAWRAAGALATPRRAPSGVGDMVVLHGGAVEVFDAWPDVDVGVLIDSADVVDGIPFAGLAAVLAWKRAWSRPKDVADVALIERHVGSSR